MLWLRADPAAATPQQLLEHLLTVSKSSPDMTAKLQLLQQRLPLMVDLGLVTDWRAFWGSAYWSNFTATANLLWKQNLAMQVRQCSCGAAALDSAAQYVPLLCPAALLCHVPCHLSACCSCVSGSMHVGSIFG